MVLDGFLDKHDWKAATARVDELLPYAPLWYEGQFAAMRQGILGFKPAADGNWDGLADITKQQGN
jgi:peptide/nickel transport system substrate-binding protein